MIIIAGIVIKNIISDLRVGLCWLKLVFKLSFMIIKVMIKQQVIDAACVIEGILIHDMLSPPPNSLEKKPKNEAFQLVEYHVMLLRIMR